MERGEIARKKLVEAGLKIFSEVGYEGASTRDLAAAAGVNNAAIPYYFGSKEGLYLAVIDYIVESFRKNLSGGLIQIREILKNKETTRTECRALLDEYMRMLVYFVLQEGEEHSQIAHIYYREQLDPTPAFDRLYEGFIHDFQETLEMLVATILDMDAHSSEVKLIAETLLGQVAIFKFSRATVLHNMGWEKYGEKGMAYIEHMVTFNVDALMQSYQKKGAAS
jgi:AcrR family transcriptional regulator